MSLPPACSVCLNLSGASRKRDRATGTPSKQVSDFFRALTYFDFILIFWLVPKSYHMSSPPHSLIHQNVSPFIPSCFPTQMKTHKSRLAPKGKSIKIVNIWMLVAVSQHTSSKTRLYCSSSAMLNYIPAHPCGRGQKWPQEFVAPLISRIAHSFVPLLIVVRYTEHKILYFN